jgi:hypothetical protein
MTTVTTNTSASGHLGREVPGFFAKIWHGLIAIAEVNPRLKQLEYLASLSDTELAAKGLRREDIARHVFRNKIYL